MRKDTCRHEQKRKSPSHSSQETIDLTDWRSRVRPQILRDFVDQTRDLSWSRGLIDLLLDELHVSDEFDDLVGPASQLSTQQYPQIVAIALVLRHSWFPEDHARVIAQLGVPSALLAARDRSSSLQPATADTAVGTASASSLRRVRTPLKGNSQC